MKHTDIINSLSLEQKCALLSGGTVFDTRALPGKGIPSITLSDGPNGVRKQAGAADHLGLNPSVPATCFPTSATVANSWDPALGEAVGEAMGEEAAAQEVSVLLGPGLNIKRSPLCGRNFEYYSEDPVLAGELAAGYINGVQSQGVGTSIKHFAANNQEYRRMSASSDMTERTLREIYLPAFETAVKKSQPWTVMCSYNRVNDVFASESRMLLTDILRTEWNFKGFVMSDWGAVADRVKGVAAGLDLEMPGSGGVNDAKIVAAVKAGTLSEAALDKAVIRILNIVFRAADEAAAPAPELDLKGDHTIAAELAKECAVLLQNRGVLPLKKGSKVVYIGGFAKTPRYQGGGSSHINTIRVDSALEMAESHGRRVSYVEGFPADLDQREEEEFLRAVSAAAEADAAVIFAGLPESFESEGFDRSHMRLPESQNNLIARVAAVQKNTVVVLHTGSPVECPWANDVNAVLCMYLGGEGVGAAADALLWGDANPSGRLPETWPLRLEDTPCYLDFPGDGRHVEYREGVYVGYRWYDARKMPVLWPFGHGLSYTGFVYRNAQLTADEFAEGDSVRVRVSVKNVGMMPGKEVVQLYVADCTGTTGRPPKELRKFVKVKLEPGEEKQVEFTLTAQDLSYYDETLGSWYAAPGEYKILLGHSSRDIHATLSVRFSTPRRRPFVIDENTTIGELSKDDRTAAIIQQVLAQAGNALTGGNAGGSEIASSEAVAQMLDSMPLRGIVNFGGPAAAGMITPLLEILRDAIQ